MPINKVNGSHLISRRANVRQSNKFVLFPKMCLIDYVAILKHNSFSIGQILQLNSVSLRAPWSRQQKNPLNKLTHVFNRSCFGIKTIFQKSYTSSLTKALVQAFCFQKCRNESLLFGLALCRNRGRRFERVRRENNLPRSVCLLRVQRTPHLDRSHSGKERPPAAGCQHGALQLKEDRSEKIPASSCMQSTHSESKRLTRTGELTDWAKEVNYSPLNR